METPEKMCLFIDSALKNVAAGERAGKIPASYVDAITTRLNLWKVAVNAVVGNEALQAQILPEMQKSLMRTNWQVVESLDAFLCSAPSPDTLIGVQNAAGSESGSIIL